MTELNVSVNKDIEGVWIPIEGGRVGVYFQKDSERICIVKYVDGKKYPYAVAIEKDGTAIFQEPNEDSVSFSNIPIDLVASALVEFLTTCDYQNQSS